jgi:hypothetical protein
MSDVILDPENTMADQDVCIAVGEYLTQHYPGHPWCVGCSHQPRNAARIDHGGTVNITLGYSPDRVLDGRPGAFLGYLLYISTVLGPGGAKRVMQAGGELLERWGLPRCGAGHDSALDAKAHGLIKDAAVK